MTPEAPALYPSLAWVRNALYRNAYASYSRKDHPVRAAMIVGSVARGAATESSDLDIAVIIPAMPKTASIKFTERYHQKYHADSQYPKWNGRRVDFQFFFDAPGGGGEADMVPGDYSTIALK